MTITMSNIRKRKTYLERNPNKNINTNILSENAKKGNELMMENLMKNWKNLNYDEDFAINELMETYNTFIENCNSESDIKKSIIFFAEEVIPSIKNLKGFKKNINKNLYSAFQESINEYTICDRVLNNQEKLNKINFEKVIKESNLFGKENLQICVESLCDKIDSLKISFPIKYNLALENVLYSFDKCGVRVNKKELLESVTDYFLLKESTNQENIKSIDHILTETSFYEKPEKENLNYLIEGWSDPEPKTLLEEHNQKNKASSLGEIIKRFKSIPDKTPDKAKELVKQIYANKDVNIINETPNFFAAIRLLFIGALIGTNPYVGVLALFTDQFIAMGVKRKEAEKMMEKYKKELSNAQNRVSKEKDPKKKEKLEQYEKEIQKNYDKIENYTDSLYSDKELENKWSTENEAASKQDDDSIVDSFIDSMIDIPDEKPITIKEYFQDYHPQTISEMDKAINNLKEIAEKKYKRLLDENIIKIIDVDELNKFKYINDKTITNYLGTDNTLIVSIAYFLSIEYCNLKHIRVDSKSDDAIHDLLSDLCDTIQDTLSENYCCMWDGTDDLYHILLSFNIPIDIKKEKIVKEEVVHKDQTEKMALILAIEDELANYGNTTTDALLNSLDKSIDGSDPEYVDTVTDFMSKEDKEDVKESVAKLYEEHARKLFGTDAKNKIKITTNLTENAYKLRHSKVDNHYSNPYQLYNQLHTYNEGIDAINDYYNDKILLRETSFTNTLRLTRERLKKSALKFTDKEKMMSRTLDSSLETFNNKVQNAITNRNREKIIKGTVLPSASNIIKICIGTGVVAMISPALAVVGILGGLAMSKMSTQKERQFILDEIDIQEKLVDKKIQMAEGNNDMKSMEELLKLQKRLRREKQRIHYHMKNYYPVTSNND